MTEHALTHTEQRHIALGAARSQLRRLGMPLDPYTVSFEDVLAVLDDLCRAEPDLVASQWYRQASEQEIRLLRQEWLRQWHTNTSTAGRWRPRRRTTGGNRRSATRQHHRLDSGTRPGQEHEQIMQDTPAADQQTQQEAARATPRYLARYRREEAASCPWQVYDAQEERVLAAYRAIDVNDSGQAFPGEWLAEQQCAQLNGVPEELDTLFAELDEAPEDQVPSAEPWDALIPEQQSRRLYGTLACGMLLPLACLLFQIVLLVVTPPITITLFPNARTLTATASLHLVADSTIPTTPGGIHGHLLAPLTLSQTGTAPATGTGHQDARQARGTITFYNGEFTALIVPAGTTLTGTSGVQVSIDQSAPIPAANPPSLGQVTVPAHAVSAGPQGNIAARDIDQPCCLPSVFAVNTTPFTGGQNARDFQIVTQADIQSVAPMLKAALVQSIQGALTARLAQGEALYPLPCPLTFMPDHQPGEEANQVRVTVSATCTGVAYHQEELVASTQQLLSVQATRHLGAGYSLLGSVQVQVTQAVVQQAGVTLVVHCQGTWAYQLSDQAQQHLISLLLGKTKAQALHLLAQVPGIERATIAGLTDNQRLPKESSAIHILVLYVGGDLPAGGLPS